MDPLLPHSSFLALPVLPSTSRLPAILQNSSLAQDDTQDEYHIKPLLGKSFFSALHLVGAIYADLPAAILNSTKLWIIGNDVLKTSC